MGNKSKRSLYDAIEKHLTRPQHTIIVGARQVGKSTLMRQLHDEQKRLGKPVVWLNLEQRDVLQALNANPLNLLSYLPANHEGDKVIVFIDEVQYLNDPSNFLKLIYDEYQDRVKVVASGSSAFYIDDKFNDSLAGRKRLFRMFTCSFAEHLLLSGKDDLYTEYNRIVSTPNALSTQMPLLEAEMRTFIRFGGYPAVVTERDEKEKALILTELRDSFLKRDVVEAGVQNTDAFYALFRLLAAQSGNLLNTNELSKMLKMKNETVQRYVDILNKCCHVGIVRPFFRNLGKELTKMPKLYILDNGMRRCLLGNLQSDISPIEEGAAWEGLVYRALLEHHDFEGVNFWRTTAGNEVDFVIPHANKPFAIEVKRTNGAAKPSRYTSFVDAYPDLPLTFIEGFPLNEQTLRNLYE